MSDQPQNISGAEAIDKAKDLAKDNPEATRSAIDRLEDVVDARTGGKFKDLVDKGGDLLERSLGVEATEPPMPSPTPVPDPGRPAPAPEPGQPVPTPDPGPVPSDPGQPAPEPRTPSPEPGETTPEFPDRELPQPSDPVPPTGEKSLPDPIEPTNPETQQGT